VRRRLLANILIMSICASLVLCISHTYVNHTSQPHNVPRLVQPGWGLLEAQNVISSVRVDSVAHLISVHGIMRARNDTTDVVEFVSRFFDENATAFGIGDWRREYRLIDGFRPPYRCFIRFSQEKDSVPVFGGFVWAYVDSGPVIGGLWISHYDIGNVETVPLISSYQAIRTAARYLDVGKSIPRTLLMKLVIYPQLERPCLAWRIKFHVNIETDIFINARNGRLLCKLGTKSLSGPIHYDESMK
jgi:hypothetical protein